MNFIAATLEITDSLQPLWYGMVLGVLWYAAQPDPRKTLVKVRRHGR